MKIPKYIDEALKKRSKAAVMFNKYDFIISTFIDKNNIDVDMADYHGGVESIINPTESEMAIREAVCEHKKS